MAKTERIADREHEITDTHNFRIANRHFDQPIRFDLEQRNIGGCIRADNYRIEDLAINQRNLNFVGILHNMMVGQNIAAGCINDYAGSGAGHFPGSTGSIRQSEESAKGVIAIRRAPRNCLADPDINDCRRYSLDKRGKTRKWFVLDILGKSRAGNAGHGEQQSGQQESVYCLHREPHSNYRPVPARLVHSSKDARLQQSVASGHRLARISGGFDGNSACLYFRLLRNRNLKNSVCAACLDAVGICRIRQREAS